MSLNPDNAVERFRFGVRSGATSVPWRGLAVALLFQNDGMSAAVYTEITDV